MIATSTSFPIFMYMLGFVGIGTAVLTGIIMCILAAVDKKKEDGKLFGTDTSGVLVIVGGISAVFLAFVSGHMESKCPLRESAYSITRILICRAGEADETDEPRKRNGVHPVK